jgi:hypothetical protein
MARYVMQCKELQQKAGEEENVFINKAPSPCELTNPKEEEKTSPLFAPVDII